jgi:hypothetical protein
MKTMALPGLLFSKLASNSHSSHHVELFGDRRQNAALGVHNADAIRSLYFHWICHVLDGFPCYLAEGSGPAMESEQLFDLRLHVLSFGENKYDSCGSGMGHQQCAKVLQAFPHLHRERDLPEGNGVEVVNCK